MSGKVILQVGALLVAPTLIVSGSKTLEGSNCRSSKNCTSLVTTPSTSPTSSPTSSVSGTPTSAATSTVLYDTSVGVGVDAEGFAVLPLREGARRLFVNSATGSDSNGCSGAVNPSAALRTLDAARLCIVPHAGAGDQILVAEGTRYAEGLPNLSYRNGFSAAYPTVVQSYDPTDPFNETRYGRATGSRRPVLALPATGSAVTTAVDSGSYFAFRGLDLDGGDQPGVAVTFVGTNSYVLVENNIFRQTMLSFDRWDGGQATSHVVRKNAFYGEWHPTAHAQGIYDDGTDALTVEDNVFWHNGWRVGVSRDADPANGGPTMFRHSVYAQTRTSALVRRNLFLDPAATGCSCRGDITASENVFIDNPMAIFAGIGNDYNVYRPKGVAIDIGYNLILGDADLNSANPRGQAINTANGKPGSSAHNNFILRSRDTSAVNVLTLNNQAIYNQPSYMAFTNNLVYRFSPVMASTGGPYPAQVYTTYANNLWDAAPSGTNTSSADVAFTNPMTSAALFSTLGCTSKDQCALIMINSPEQRWAAKIRDIVWPGYSTK